MCGITGYISLNKSFDEKAINKMVKTQHHRGPDDRGSHLKSFGNCQIALGQSRLSIIDLSEHGHQPMFYENLVMVFNGEVYNYASIKKELESLGHTFNGNSDSEVIIHAYKQWGKASVEKFIGMFAIAIWDSINQTLTFIRDRSGVKPLYYAKSSYGLVFGSELKSLMAFPDFVKEVDPKVLKPYLNLGYISAPHTIFKNCFKLEPGHILQYTPKTNSIEKEEYWNSNSFYNKQKLTLGYEEAKIQLKDLLISSFKYRMVADVPVGVFLSGGYDSTAVTAILQSECTSRLNTFTIGFEEGSNEAPFARATANYLGTNHSEYICTTQEAQEIIPNLCKFYDEPFGDSSAIPTTLVSRLAQKSVSVALSADGGDEVFCGYNNYFKLNQYLRQLQKIPKEIRDLMPNFSPIISPLKTILPHNRYHQLESVFRSASSDSLLMSQRLFDSMNYRPDHYMNSFLKNKDSYGSPFSPCNDSAKNGLESAMLVYYNSYLPDNILTKVDRATMSASLEGREPLLDHRIFEFAAQLPLDYKFRGGSDGKRILKDIVEDYLPKEMMNRPKSGFSLPILKWLRGDLSYLLDDYLSEEALAWSGLFNEKFVANEVRMFRENKMHYSRTIWYLLMFQMWWDTYMRS